MHTRLVSSERLDMVSWTPQLRKMLLKVVFPLALAALNCGYEPVHLRSPSPDGRTIAEVRSRFTLDPPAQSLWIKTPEEAPKKLANLQEDSEWCEKIVWSPDSSKVAFLITGLRLDVYNLRNLSLVSSVPLVHVDGYPGSREARDVRFSRDGSFVEFRDCRRSQPDCGPSQNVVLR